MLTLLIAALIGLPTGSMVALEEDSPLWNCHVNGNGICGPGAPWHGFVNVGEVEP